MVIKRLASISLSEYYRGHFFLYFLILLFYNTQAAVDKTNSGFITPPDVSINISEAYEIQIQAKDSSNNNISSNTDTFYLSVKND